MLKYQSWLVCCEMMDLCSDSVADPDLQLRGSGGWGWLFEVLTMNVEFRLQFEKNLFSIKQRRGEGKLPWICHCSKLGSGLWATTLWGNYTDTSFYRQLSWSGKETNTVIRIQRKTGLPENWKILDLCWRHDFYWNVGFRHKLDFHPQKTGLPPNTGTPPKPELLQNTSTSLPPEIGNWKFHQILKTWLLPKSGLPSKWASTKNWTSTKN